MAAQTTHIDKIYFLIHPCCWSMADSPTPEYLETYHVRPSEWFAARNLEQETNRKQKELIQSMGPNEVLIIYPIGQSKPMLDLIATGERELGPRCIVQQAPCCEAPAQLRDMSEPIRHFLDDEEMEGRQAYWDVVPEALRPEIEQEIRDACDLIGYDWDPGALKVIQGNRAYAQEFADAFEQRGLVVDPETVTAEAFGEGFEQCAMTWKSMVAGYLGWRHPIENNFELSVSGFPHLFDAQLKERIHLDHDIRLFLWQKWHGLPMALIARAQGRLADPRCRVGGGAPQRWPPSAAQTGHTVFPYPAFTKVRLASRLDGRNQEDKTHKAHLGVELTFRELLPTPTSPAFESMRPDASQNPAVETREKLTDVGFVVIEPPSSNDRIDLVDQLLRSYRSLPTGPSPYLILEVLGRLLPGISIQVSFADTRTDLT